MTVRGRWHGGQVELTYGPGGKLAGGDEVLLAAVDAAVDAGTVVWLTPTGPAVPLRRDDPAAVVAYSRDELGVEWPPELEATDSRTELPEGALG